MWRLRGSTPELRQSREERKIEVFLEQQPLPAFLELQEPGPRQLSAPPVWVVQENQGACWSRQPVCSLFLHKPSS